MSKLAPFLVVLIACTLTSCKKKSEPQTASTPPSANHENTPTASSEAPLPVIPAPASAQPAKPLPPPTPAVAARAENLPRQNVAGQVDPELTSELRAFIQKKNRFPESFTEFATVRLDTIPRPPEGKKWVIDTQSLEVKAVSAK